MACAAVMAAVRARLDANWTRCPVFYANEGMTAPADKGAFLSVQYPVATEEQKTVGAPGNNVFREAGVIRLVLSIPIGAGVDAYSVWLDELRALFRGKQFDHVTTWAPSGGVLDDRNDDGGYWMLSSAVEYYFDLHA